ncbi:MAG TPA: DUF6401 family natural product biosynthesis protein [Micromonosporaceae bacterium]|nr:DUF6401 family natural product biosynthesis protein [Micromonosporaceae bacterium]
MHSELSNGARHAAARSTLGGLMTWLGRAGIEAARGTPTLLAAVDQHAAAVRDALSEPSRGLAAVALAGYACGVRDTAIEHNWQVPDPADTDWRAADWPTLRLLGVCSLARTHGWA